MGDHTLPQDDDLVPDAAAARVLIDELLDDVITDEGRHRLEELVTADPAIARIYVRAMHLWSQLPLHLGLRQSIPPTWQAEATNELLSETMVMDALKLELQAEEPLEEEVFQPAPATGLDQLNRQRGFWQKVNAFKKWIGIAAVMLFGAGVGWSVWPGSPPAVVAATAGALINGTSLRPGSRLVVGQSIDLTRGGIELRFRSGATVTIVGPARFSLDQNNSMTLYSGVLAAHVPQTAVGFSVSSPGLKVVDLGTSFGIRTIGDDQGSDAAVFEGNITVAATDPQGTGLSCPVSLGANSAMAHTINGGPKPLAVLYSPDLYPRDISKIRLPLKLYDTGAEPGTDGGDAHWQATRVALTPDWTAQPAKVFNPSLAEFSLSGAASICPQGVASPPPAGEYIFRTTVDLTGFDASSAVVVAHVLATEAIVDIRVNGLPATGTSLLDASGGETPRSQVLQLPTRLWNPGKNTIDFVLNYLPDDMPRFAFAGLCVKWDASASPVVRR